MFISPYCVFFRFVIHKHIRRDLIPSLPLPRRMIDYLNTPHYYSEHFVDLSESESNEEQLVIGNYQTTITEEVVANPNVPVNYVVVNNATSNISYDNLR